MASPRMNINTIRNLPNFATSFRWYLTAVAPSMWNSQIVTTAPGIAWPDVGGIDVRLESITEAQLTGESTTINIRGHAIKQPGIHTYSGTITMSFYETEDNFIMKWLRTWREMCWACTDGAQLPRNGVETTFNLFRLSSMDVPLWRHTFYGVFLETYDSQTLDATTPEYKPSATFSFDYYEDEELGVAAAPVAP